MNETADLVPYSWYLSSYIPFDLLLLYRSLCNFFLSHARPLRILGFRYGPAYSPQVRLCGGDYAHKVKLGSALGFRLCRGRIPCALVNPSSRLYQVPKDSRLESAPQVQKAGS